MGNEVIPVDELIAEFVSEWNAGETGNATPNFVVVTGDGEPLRFDLNAGDAVVARFGTFTEMPIGNWKYGNRTYTINIELWTLRNRQRLYNLMKEMRRICHSKMHLLTNFQRMQFMNFTEMTTDTVNVWMATSEITLENNAVLLET